MSDTYRVSVSARIPAPPGRIYGIIADYKNGHPHILPPAFSNLEVEEGGVGAGTIVRFNVRALGRTQPFRSVVTEPEPGRVLVETNVEGPPSTSTFTVNSVEGGREADVTIDTVMKRRPGLAGAIEEWVTVRLLRRIYREELRLL